MNNKFLLCINISSNVFLIFAFRWWRDFWFEVNGSGLKICKCCKRMQ